MLLCVNVPSKRAVSGKALRQNLDKFESIAPKIVLMAWSDRQHLPNVRSNPSAE